jgi:hypothetical protein
MGKSQLADKLETIAEPVPVLSIAKALAGTTLSPEHMRQSAAVGHTATHILAHARSQIDDVAGTLRQLISTMPAYDSNIPAFNELISRLV